MKRKYLYIDDSGDPGFKTTSTSHLVIAAVLLLDEDKKLLLDDAITIFRRNLGWSELHEFKFNTAKKEIILDLIEFVKPFDFTAHVMVLDKAKVKPEKMPKDNASLYYHVIKELLLKLNLAECEPIISIDGRAGRQYAREIKTYLRKSLREKGVEKSRIYLVDSRKNSLIQLADVVAGSVARSYRTDKSDAKVYKKALDDKITKIHEMNL